MEQLSEKESYDTPPAESQWSSQSDALAKATGISKQVISYRIRRMEETGVILGYHAITNSYALGKAITESLQSIRM
jgi:DNA-binding Lrp family transcriptional regulator